MSAFLVIVGTLVAGFAVGVYMGFYLAGAMTRPTHE